MMTACMLGLVVSILAYLAVGIYAGHKVKHLEDHFVAGRHMLGPDVESVHIHTDHKWLC